MTKRKPFGEFLKEARLKAGFSQKEVSSFLGYTTPQFVSNWERGLTTPPGRTLRKIADLYRIVPAQLYDVLLDHVLTQTEEALKAEFFGSPKRRVRQ